MKVFWCKDFVGAWPVGASAIIVAGDKVHAADLLNRQIQLESLPTQIVHPESMVEIDPHTPVAIIINDGDY